MLPTAVLLYPLMGLCRFYREIKNLLPEYFDASTFKTTAAACVHRERQRERERERERETERVSVFMCEREKER